LKEIDRKVVRYGYSITRLGIKPESPYWKMDSKENFLSRYAKYRTEHIVTPEIDI
jgi:hypothetical protein